MLKRHFEWTQNPMACGLVLPEGRGPAEFPNARVLDAGLLLALGTAGPRLAETVF